MQSVVYTSLILLSDHHSLHTHARPIAKKTESSFHERLEVTRPYQTEQRQQAVSLRFAALRFLHNDLIGCRLSLRSTSQVGDCESFIDSACKFISPINPPTRTRQIGFVHSIQRQHHHHHGPLNIHSGESTGDHAEMRCFALNTVLHVSYI